MNALLEKAHRASSGTAQGFRARDGRFDEDPLGLTWLMFDEPNDVVYWHPRTGDLATYHGRAFALNEDAISYAPTYALEGRLRIHATVEGWIEANQNGIVVIDWRRAFDMLRDAPRIVVDEAAVAAYQKHMVPPAMPQVFVRLQKKRNA